MTEGTATHDELTRRLTALAETTTTDPDAWDRISERTGSLPPAGRPLSRRPGPWMLAAAAVVALLLGLVAVIGGRDDGDNTRTSDDRPEPTTTVPRPTTTPTPSTTTATTEPPSTTVSEPSSTGAPPETASGGTGDAPTPAIPACPAEGARCAGQDRGDVDGDGSIDAVGLYAPPGGGRDPVTVTVRVVFGSGGMAEYPVTGVAAAPQLLGVTDLNGDGRDEIAYLYDSGASFGWGWFVGSDGGGGLGPVGFGEEQPLMGGAATVVGGFSCPDVDGDGRREVVLSSGYTDDGVTAQVRRQVYRWEGTVLVLAEDVPGTASVGDDDGDGVPDYREGRSGVDCPGLQATGW